MISHFWSLILLLCLGMQANQAPEITDVLTTTESAALTKATKIDGRIKVYQTASERFRADLSTEMAKHNYSAIPDTLKLWAQLLKISLKDIDESITNRKKKSGALIHYEIKLRRSITDTQAYKTAVPVDVIDEFDTWLAHAESVHQKFVDILFPK